jgi:hypothetical protein
MLSSQVPLAMASKAMRHSTLSTTTEIYGHSLRHVAHQAVDSIDAVSFPPYAGHLGCGVSGLRLTRSAGSRT